MGLFFVFDLEAFYRPLYRPGVALHAETAYFSLCFVVLAQQKVLEKKGRQRGTT